MKSINIFRIILISVLFVSGLFSNNNQADKVNSSVKVLFLGNSLTGNGLPDIINGLVDETSNTIYTDKIILGGRSLLEISQTDSFASKISSENWDYIVMQDSPYRVAYPDSFTAYPTRDALDRIKSMANVNTILMLFMPYAYKDGMAWYQDYTDGFFEMQQKIYDYSLVLANDYNLKIAPVGWAWYNVMFEGNSIELYKPDQSHPNGEGTYLNACVIYSSIFEEDLANNQYYNTVSPTDANYLQAIASATVMDDLDSWNYLSIEDTDSKIGEKFVLHQNYPNPFNPETTISFDLPIDSDVSISIYDLQGIEIAKLLSQSLVSGNHQINWNGTDDNGIQVSSGVYLYKVVSDRFIQTKKMILLR